MGMNTESGYSQAYYSISTHTPVWGWTQIRLKVRPKCNYFNPHPRMGDEQTIVVQVSVFAELQPASLHRDERNNLIKNQLYRIFNSHHVWDEPGMWL